LGFDGLGSFDRLADTVVFGQLGTNVSEYTERGRLAVIDPNLEEVCDAL
jgi:hypothetical protein